MFIVREDTAKELFSSIRLIARLLQEVFSSLFSSPFPLVSFLFFLHPQAGSRAFFLPLRY